VLKFSGSPDTSELGKSGEYLYRAEIADASNARITMIYTALFFKIVYIAFSKVELRMIPQILVSTLSDRYAPIKHQNSNSPAGHLLLAKLNKLRDNTD
jgi:hypothetical protein